MELELPKAEAVPQNEADTTHFRGSLSLLLRGGVVLSASLCGLGILLCSLRGGLPMTFGGDGLTVGLRARLAAGDPTALIGLGVMVLALVPVVRVVYSLFFFARERDRTFVFLTTLVLGLLAVGVLMGRAL